MELSPYSSQLTGFLSLEGPLHGNPIIYLLSCHPLSPFGCYIRDYIGIPWKVFLEQNVLTK
jgi:hypothetical protein